MSFSFSKAFSLSAMAAVSTMGVSIAQPAEAITFTRSTAPVYTDPSGYTTQLLKDDINDLSLGGFSTKIVRDNTPNRAVITDISQGQGDVTVGGTGADGFFQFANQGGQNISRLQFSFDTPLAYFGVQMLNLGSNATIQFFNGNNPLVFTNPTVNNPLSFSSISGSGNYYNFYIPVLTERVTRVVIAGQNVRLDDVAYRVPTPTLLPSLVGMSVAALRKRQQEEGESA